MKKCKTVPGFFGRKALKPAVALALVFCVSLSLLPQPFGVMARASAAGAPTPALTDGGLPAYELAATVDPDAIRFNNLEWSGNTSVSAGLPNQGRQSQVYEVNRQKPHAVLTPYETVAKAVKGARDYDREQSKYFMPLTTPEDLDPLTSNWTFSLVSSLTKTLATANATKDPLNPTQNIVDFYKRDYNADNWPGIAVPSSWQVQGIGADGKPYTGYYDPEYGYDPPYFTNIDMPGSITFRGPSRAIFNGVSIPGAPDVYNPVGFYRRSFDVPEDWIANKNKVFISFEGVEAAFYVYLNGKEVGYHEDRMTPGEFDLTPFLTADGKDNLLAVKVYRWADCSWMDDQDQIRLGGIGREVYLMATPGLHIRDYKVETDFDETYTNATLKLDVWARNYTSNLDLSGYGVTAQLFDPSGADILKDATIDLSLAGLTANTEIKVTGEVTVLNPHKWFPDDPYLYTLVLSVYDKATNQAVEHISQQLGFREIVYRDAEDKTDIIRINGQKLMMFGTNRSDETADGGRYVQPEVYENDIKAMKRNNINTIRTSHYPSDTYLYYLADRYGLMICAESNNESHANTSSSITENNFYGLANSRVQNNVEKFKNFPSVVMWSLGNESGNQTGFRTIIQNIHAVDHTRPVHYEPAGNNVVAGQPNQSVDVRSSMYTSVSGYQSNCRNSNVKSVMLCEYEHACGNAMGNLREYVDVFRSEPRAIGGCLWDFADQAVWTKIPNNPFAQLSESGPYALTGTANSGAAGLFTELADYGQTLKPGVSLTYANTAGTGGLDIFNEHIRGRAPFTVEAWVSPSVAKSQQVFIGKGDNQFGLKQRDANQIQFTVYAGGNWNSANANTPANFLDGKLHHIVGTFDGTNVRLYWDGVQLASATMAADRQIVPTDHAMAVGACTQSGSSRDSASSIAAARVYTRALSVAEIQDASRKPGDARPTEDDSIIFWGDYSKGEAVDVYPNTWDYYESGLFLGFGGDWGEGNHNAQNCADGSISATHDEQPEMAEIKKCYQTLNFTATESELLSRTVNVRNEYYATNGNAFDYTWIVTENGVETGRGSFAVPSIPAAQNGMDVFFDIPTVALSVPYVLPETLRPGAEYHLTVQASLKTATEWADAGYVVAEEQFLLPAGADKAAPAVRTEGVSAIEITEDEMTLVLTGDDFAISFGKKDGLVTDFTAGGEQLLSEGPRPVFWRAVTHSDNVASNGWANVDTNLPVPDFRVEPSDDGLFAVVSVSYPITSVNANSFIDMTYTVYFNGAVNVVTAMRTTDTSQIYRFGVDMVMPEGYEDIEWLTRGPQENFNDRVAGAHVGRYSTTVSDNYYPFIKPMQTGQHQDTRWMALTGEDKDAGLLVVATGEKTFEANALHFGWRDLQKLHPYLLAPRADTVVSVGYGSRGSGCAHSRTLPQYQLSAGNLSYSYTLVPFEKDGADIQTLADSYRFGPRFDFGYTAKNSDSLLAEHSANIQTSLTEGGVPVESYTVALFGEEYPGGIIRLAADKIPAPGSYSVTYRIDGEIAATSMITVKAYNKNIWEFDITPAEGNTVLTFHAVIGADNASVAVNGETYTSRQVGNTIVIEDYSPKTGDEIVVTGVKYPEFFASYTFSFRKTYFYYPTLQFEAEDLPRESNKPTDVGEHAGGRNGKYPQFTSAASVGDWMEFTIEDIPAGNYQVIFGYKFYTGRGACQLYVDGVPLGPIVDQLGSQDTYGFTEMGTMALSGTHKFRFVVTRAGTLTVDYIDLVGVK